MRPADYLDPWWRAEDEMRVLWGCFEYLGYDGCLGRNYLYEDWDEAQFREFYRRFKRWFRAWFNGRHGGERMIKAKEALRMRYLDRHESQDCPATFKRVASRLKADRPPHGPLTPARARQLVCRAQGALICGFPWFTQVIRMHKLVNGIEGVRTPTEDDLLRKFIRDGLCRLSQRVLDHIPCGSGYYGPEPLIREGIRGAGSAKEVERSAKYLAKLLARMELEGTLEPLG